MSKPILAMCTIAVAIAFATGCCIDRVYQPSSCNDGWDSVLGSCNQCGSCGGGCEGHTPCQAMKHSLTCGSGCGEIYWGEWTSDPPDDCDPCDNCGNWIGPTCCAPAWWERFKTGLSGWRHGSDSCCGEGGCSSCSGGGCSGGGCSDGNCDAGNHTESYEGGYESDGHVVEGSIMNGSPTLAPGNGDQEHVPAPNGSAMPRHPESIQKQPKPAIPAEPMPEHHTRHRAAPQRRAPNLLPPNNQPHRHPSSVLAKSARSAQSRSAAAKSTGRPSPPQVKQATRFE
jgi:hypothetical protein